MRRLVLAAALAASVTASTPAMANHERRARRTARDRPPRRLRVPARAHAQRLPAGDRHGRRLHRARPRVDQGPQARRAPRARDLGHHRRRAAPRVRLAPDHEGRSTASRRPAGSPTTSRSPSCARCARWSGSRASGRPTRPSTAASRSPRSRRSSTSPRRRASGSTPRPSTRRTSTATGLSLEEPLLATLQGQRPRQAPVAGVHPVLRGLQPAGAQPQDQGAARAADERDAAGRTTSPSRATRAPTRTSPAPAGSRTSPSTPTASARTRTRSSRATRRTGCCSRRRWCATRTGPGWSCTRTRSGPENTFLPADFQEGDDPARARRSAGRAGALLPARRRRRVRRQPRHRGGGAAPRVQALTGTTTRALR